MSQSNMKVFNEYVMPATRETLAQKIQLFNAASRGVISLSMDGFTGDFMNRSFWNSLAGARRRVNRYASNDTVAATQVSEDDMRSVKIAGGFGPIEFEPSQMSWLQRPTAQAIELASAEFADLLLQDQLNTALGAAVAAISSEPDAVHDISAGDPITFAALNNAHAKFGDASSLISVHVMSGAMKHKLIGQNLANASSLFVAGNVNIIDILGQVSIFTDCPALSVAADDPAPAKDRVLALVPGAISVGGSSDVQTSLVENITGRQRLYSQFQADYTFTLGIKGYSWVSVQKSPADSVIFDPDSWEMKMQSIKNSAGILIVGQA